MSAVWARFAAWTRARWPVFVTLVLGVLALLGGRLALRQWAQYSDALAVERLRRERQRQLDEARLREAQQETASARAARAEAEAAQYRAAVLAAEAESRARAAKLRELSDSEATERFRRNIKPWLAVLVLVLTSHARADSICVARAEIDAANASIESCNSFRETVLPRLADELRVTREQLDAVTDERDAARAGERAAVESARDDRAAAHEDREKARKAQRQRWLWSGVSAAVGAVLGGIVVGVAR